MGMLFETVEIPITIKSMENCILSWRKYDSYIKWLKAKNTQIQAVWDPDANPMRSWEKSLEFSRAQFLILKMKSWIKLFDSVKLQRKGKNELVLM